MPNDGVVSFFPYLPHRETESVEPQQPTRLSFKDVPVGGEVHAIVFLLADGCVISEVAEQKAGSSVLNLVAHLEADGDNAVEVERGDERHEVPDSHPTT